MLEGLDPRGVSNLRSTEITDTVTAAMSSHANTCLIFKYVIQQLRLPQPSRYMEFVTPSHQPANNAVNVPEFDFLHFSAFQALKWAHTHSPFRQHVACRSVNTLKWHSVPKNRVIIACHFKRR